MSNLGLKLDLVGNLTYFWCLLTKSTTLDTLLALKHQKEITKLKNQTCVSFGPKTSNLGLKLVFMGHLTNFWCLLSKSTSLEILLALKHYKEILKIKNETWVSIGPKTSNWA